MKKYLQFCLMGLLVLGMGLSLGSCKDENEGSGSPNPLLGVQVDLSEIDSTAIALVDIDQANKLITISLSKTVTDLSAVPVTFDLVNGAYLYTPYVTNPVLMDLTEETGVNIATGDNIVCYKLVAEEDQALRSLKATANGIEGITNVDQVNKLIDICFEDNDVDLSAINLEFELSPVSSMVSPSTPTATVDLSADTSIVKVYNEFKGEVEYKVICWNYPTGGVMDVKEYSDVQVTAGAEGEFQIKTTGENPAILTNRYPVSYGMVMEFEYKSDVDLGRPVFSLDLNNKDLQIRGYELAATSEWKTSTIDISPLYFDAGKNVGKSYTIHMALGEEVPEDVMEKGDVNKAYFRFGFVREDLLGIIDLSDNHDAAIIPLGDVLSYYDEYGNSPTDDWYDQKLRDLGIILGLNFYPRHLDNFRPLYPTHLYPGFYEYEFEYYEYPEKGYSYFYNLLPARDLKHLANDSYIALFNADNPRNRVNAVPNNGDSELLPDIADEIKADQDLDDGAGKNPSVEVGERNVIAGAGVVAIGILLLKNNM